MTLSTPNTDAEFGEITKLPPNQALRAIATLTAALLEMHDKNPSLLTVMMNADTIMDYITTGDMPK